MLIDYICNKPTIESNRIILRPLEKKDVNDLREWTINKDLYKFWGKNPGKADLNPELLFVKEPKPTKSFHLGILLKELNKIIGDIYVYLIEKNSKAKIAIRLNPSFHSLGYGTESVQTMCNWCFQNTELKTIWSDVDVNNISSIKMLEKSGFIKTNQVNNAKMVSTICNYFIYELNSK